MQPHYSVAPFSELSTCVVDAICQRLSLLSLFQCSLVCKAWRHLPYVYLGSSLEIGASASGLPPASLLHLCCHVKEIRVTSSASQHWPPVADALAQQQLPCLRALHIQHSTASSKEELQQLTHILQVQGPQCSLHLALTDKSSLQALLGLLPVPGLVQLDFNVPYLPEGAAAALAEAAALQLAGMGSWGQQQQQQQPGTAPLSQNSEEPNRPQLIVQFSDTCSINTSSSSSSSSSGATAGYRLIAPQQQQQQQQFTIGVWVCCWGGCTGIDLQDALNIQQQLQAVSCSMHGCESVNCNSSTDVAALAQLKGLRALGFNYRTSKGGGDAGDAPGAAGGGRENEGSSSCINLNVAALASALTPMASSLQQLSMHGYPAGGFQPAAFAQQAATGGTVDGAGAGVQQYVAAENLPAAPASGGGSSTGLSQLQLQQPRLQTVNPLAALTGLTKLALLKQWGHHPLPIAALAHLTGLKELALERNRLAHAHELGCLRALTGLRVLSLALNVEAAELVEEVQQGKWQVARSWQQQQQPQEVQQQQQEEVEAALQALTLARESSGGDAAGASDAVCGACTCGCCSSSDSNKGRAAPDSMATERPCAAELTAAGSSSAAGTSSLAATAAPAAAGTTPDPVSQQVAPLLRAIACCPASKSSSPMLLDWQWLSQLSQLEVAWLQVPHLDLAYLPSSLTELDAQQPHDLTSVSITCSSGSSSGGGYGDVCLPNLKRLVLPRTLRVTSCQEDTGAGTDNDACSDSSSDSGSSSSSSDGPPDLPSPDSTDDDDGMVDEDDVDDGELQLHHNAALLLQLAAGCPELRELELVQWQLPAVVAAAAADGMRYLKLLSCGTPSSVPEVQAMRECVGKVRGSVKLQLQDRLVLARYPWHSVLAAN